jgi:hypothetical protein
MRQDSATQEVILKTNFVSGDFFLDRIKELEKKYEMQWDQFLAEYSSGRLLDGRCNPEFAEWSLLCHSYMAKLLRPDESPPAIDSNPERQKPERDSGFFIFEGRFVRCSSIFRAGKQDAGNAPRKI